MVPCPSKFWAGFTGGRFSATVVALFVCWPCLPCRHLSAAESLPKDVSPFLRKHCGECHAAGAAEGGFRIESLSDRPSQKAGAADTLAYEKVYRQLSRGKMPPQDAAQPSADDRRAVLAALDTILDKVVDDSGNRYAGAFARRLNREQLQNDLLDTLGVDRRFYNLPPFAESLPDEGRVAGFDTIGAGLGQSALLLTQYQQEVDRHLALITNDYSPQRWRVKFGTRYVNEKTSFHEGLGDRVFLSGPPHSDRSIAAFDMTWQLAGRAEPPRRTEDEVAAAFRSFFFVSKNHRPGPEVLDRSGGLPLINEDSLTLSDRIGTVLDTNYPLLVAATGRYKVRMRCRLRFPDGVDPVEVRARYFNRSHYYVGRGDSRDYAVDGRTYELDEDAPRLCFENPDRSIAIQPGDWTVLEFDDFRSAAEGEATSGGVTGAVNAGLTLDFRFGSVARPRTQKPPQELPARNGHPAVVPPREEVEAHYPFFVDVDYLEVEGPLPLIDRPTDLFPAGPIAGSDARGTAVACLSKLLPRLYRGPIAQADLDVLLGVFDRNFERTNDFRGSLRSAVSAAYLSPRHLFASNTAAERKPGTPLSPHDLATRLSLFLWSSTPDAELRAAADRGELSDPAVLERQAKRLLDHPYASELSANFASQWLHLYNIGLNEPDQDLYNYDDLLKRATVNESLRFFHEVLRADGSIRLFLDSDWFMCNDRLSELYKIKFTGKEPRRPFSSWRKVPVAGLYVPQAGVRGGLLGQASILKLTSGSIRTSIVSRGMFILENILDDPPAPPPENVGEIANAVADLDQKSVREQLEIHRRRATCRACHDKIDPLGFALENYGVIGQWRTTETDGMKPQIIEEVVTSPDGKTSIKTKKLDRQGHPVDTKGVVMGVPVDGPLELRALLVSKDEVFARCLVGKLMTYGLGRSLRHQDEAVIDRIVAAAAKNGYRLREIIERIVLSESFRTY